MRRFLAFSLLFSLLAGPARAQSSIQFAPATWYQPAENFPACRARGIRTIVGYSATVPIDQWFAALKANGLTAWVQYTKDISAFLAAHPEYKSVVLGWMALPDEPNAGMPDSPKLPAGQLTDEIRSIRQAWPGVRVLVNLDGRPLRFAARADAAAYAKCGADVIAFDIYPANQGDVAPGTIGVLLDLLRSTGPPGLQVIACLENCDQDLRVSDWGKKMIAAGRTMRGPTIEEIRAEAQEAMNHGAAGVVWFEQVIGNGWEKFYGVTPAIEAQMPSINAALMPPAPAAAGNVLPTLNVTLTVNGVTYDLVPRK